MPPGAATHGNRCQTVAGRTHPWRVTRQRRRHFRRGVLGFAAFGDHDHCVALVGAKWLEVAMPTSRTKTRGSRAFAAPLFGIVVLLGCYWLLADWPQVPAIVSAAVSALHWPG